MRSDHTMRLLTGVMICICILGVSSRSLRAQSTTDYDSAFLTDAQLEDYTSMSVEEIRDFLRHYGSFFQSEIVDVDGVRFDPPSLIAEAAHRYRINPQVLLATLQKESAGVTMSRRPGDAMLSFLMGCVEPTTARDQLVCAAERFRDYHDGLASRGTTISGWRVGVPKQTEDDVTVTPATRAVAGQFTYTPYAGVQWGGNRASVGGVYLFSRAWREFGFQDVAEPVVVDSVTALVIDVSGSMANSWRGGVKLESAQRAATDVTRMIEQESRAGDRHHQIGLVSFDQDATIVVPVTREYLTAQDAITALAAGGSTSIGAGLEAANQVLREGPTASQSIIILLSDGVSNTGLASEEIIAGPVQEAAGAGTCIFTVGFGDQGDLDEGLLRRIAERSGCGTYTYAATPQELELVYLRLRHTSLGTLLAEYEGQIRQNETVEIGRLDVPQDKGELLVTLHWPGSELDLILYDPSGRQISPDERGVELMTYERMVYLIIQDPRPGTWALKALGVDVPEDVLNYHALVSVRDRITPSVSQAPAGIIVTFAAMLLTGSAVGGVVAWSSRRRTTVDDGEAVVQVISGKSRGLCVPMSGAKLTLGRAPYCDVTLADPQVSARHAMLRRTSEGYLLTDLGSRNGTYVDGQRIEASVLLGGERVRLGQTEVSFVRPHSGSRTSDFRRVKPDEARAYLMLVTSGQDYGGWVCVRPRAVIGRNASCPVDLSADALVSQNHAQLGYQNGRWYIADMGSSNGTWVNGVKQKIHWLSDGDELRLGNTRLRFSSVLT